MVNRHKKRSVRFGIERNGIALFANTIVTPSSNGLIMMIFFRTTLFPIIQTILCVHEVVTSVIVPKLLVFNRAIDFRSTRFKIEFVRVRSHVWDTIATRLFVAGFFMAGAYCAIGIVYPAIMNAVNLYGSQKTSTAIACKFC